MSLKYTTILLKYYHICLFVAKFFLRDIDFLAAGLTFVEIFSFFTLFYPFSIFSAKFFLGAKKVDIPQKIGVKTPKTLNKAVFFRKYPKKRP